MMWTLVLALSCVIVLMACGLVSLWDKIDQLTRGRTTLLDQIHHQSNKIIDLQAEVAKMDGDGDGHVGGSRKRA